MNTPSITVLVKSQYGKLVAYPHCPDSHRLARLAKTNTLTPDALKIIKELGYTINQITTSLDI